MENWRELGEKCKEKTFPFSFTKLNVENQRFIIKYTVLVNRV